MNYIIQIDANSFQNPNQFHETGQQLAMHSTSRYIQKFNSELHLMKWTPNLQKCYIMYSGDAQFVQLRTFAGLIYPNDVEIYNRK